MKKTWLKKSDDNVVNGSTPSFVARTSSGN